MLTIKQLRDKIDKIDANIIKKLSQREILSRKIGKLKSKLNKKIIDNKREETLIRRYEKLCSKYQLKSFFIKKLFKLIIVNSRKLQK
jgi:chorismate mutase